MGNLILAMAVHFSDVAIIMDELDECGDNTAEVVHLIDGLWEGGSNIKVLLSSREEQEIIDTIGHYPKLSIAARSSDLKLYVAAEIERRIQKRRLDIKSETLKEQIMDKLVNGAAGM